MITYKDYEKQVYDWLLSKHKIDKNFTFSLRQKGSKGAELDYFIGTEKSSYFGLTFWSIPVGFPGSAADLIDVFFQQKEDGFKFFFEFGQTMNPSDDQNKSALNLIRNIKESIRGIGDFTYETTQDLKMFKYALGSPKSVYTTLESLFVDLEKTLNSIIPIVENGIINEKNFNKNFIAQRISIEQFNEIYQKLEKRLFKYNHFSDFNSNTNLKTPFKFKNFTEEFENYLLENQEEFHGLKVSTKGRNYFWLEDKYNQIGDKIAHYEIILRNKKLKAEIHFEGTQKQKDTFKLSIDNLPNDLLWFKWNSSNSISSFEGNNIDDNDLVKNLANKLLLIEKNIGNQIRNVKNGLIDSNVKKPLMKNIINSPLNQILYGPPGTGKTYNSINKAIEIINSTFDLSQDRKIVKDEFDRLVADNQILFTTFHQSMSYEDFIEGIKPETKDKNVIYDVVPGLFLEICTTAENNWEDAKEGNSKKLSFEEAFLLLKEEWFENEEIKFPLKREGNDFTIIGFTKKSIQFKKASGGTGHTLSIGTLKDYYYKKKEIKPTGVGIYYPSILDKLNKYQPIIISEKVVKNHVIIIDEINRGNVSQIFGELITLIEDSKRLGNDEALEVILPYSKEKFGVPPNLYIIGTMNTADRSVEALDTALRRRFCFVEMMPDEIVIAYKKFTDYDRAAIMSLINQRIEVLLDRNYTLGHSYFIKADFKNSFENEIIPLLQEYFYNDYGKIGLVLGKGFVREKAITAKNDKSIFADFDTKNEVDIIKSYELIPFTEIDFDTAIQTLLA